MFPELYCLVEEKDIPEVRVAQELSDVAITTQDMVKVLQNYVGANQGCAKTLSDLVSKIGADRVKNREEFDKKYNLRIRPLSPANQ